LNTDWWNYGGLTRDVQLVEVPRNLSSGITLSSFCQDSPDTIAGWITLDGKSPRTENSHPHPSGKQVLGIAAQRRDARHEHGQGWHSRFPFHFPFSLVVSGKSKKLYEVHIAFWNRVYRRFDRISGGSPRTGRTILLNGKPLFLKAIAIHEEAPVSRRACSKQRRMPRILLGVGKGTRTGNYIRLGSYPAQCPHDT